LYKTAYYYFVEALFSKYYRTDEEDIMYPGSLKQKPLLQCTSSWQIFFPGLLLMHCVPLLPHFVLKTVLSVYPVIF